MAKHADSPQAVWQKKFLGLVRPKTDDYTTIPYDKWDNPATWWHNPINHNSLRLSQLGYKTLHTTDFPTYRFKLTAKVMPKTFVQLERYFTSPYYIINAQSIIVYGNTEAMMIALHANNLQQYLDNQSQ
jgi:hypothetical protein